MLMRQKLEDHEFQDITGWRACPAFKSTGCSSGGSIFNSQHPHGRFITVILISGNLILFWSCHCFADTKANLELLGSQLKNAELSKEQCLH